MTLAVDYSFARPSPEQLTAAGIGSVGRYLTGADKAIQAAELSGLIHAGITVWFVFEVGANDIAGGADAGVNHAMQVAAALSALYVPSSQPVYFAVDETVPPAAAVPYFQGVATVRPSQSSGCYGSGAVIQTLFDARLIAYGWQSMSTGYAGNDKTLPVTAIQQTEGAPPLPTTDLDVIFGADWGQYPRPAAPPVPPSPTLVKPTTGRYGTMNAPVVAVASMPTGQGYTLVGSDGGTFNFGTAPMLGSLANHKLNAPIVDAVHTPDGKGLLLAATDGGVFAFGDAPFDGSEGGKHLNAPVVGIAVTPDGKGYWLAAADGGVFAFGGASFKGSAG